MGEFQLKHKILDRLNDLVLMVGILGILFAGYFFIAGKDTSTSLFVFISGASLVFLWGYLRKPKQDS